MEKASRKASGEWGKNRKTRGAAKTKTAIKKAVRKAVTEARE